jgi:hypothetical protein
MRAWVMLLGVGCVAPGQPAHHITSDGRPALGDTEPRPLPDRPTVRVETLEGSVDNDFLFTDLPLEVSLSLDGDSLEALAEAPREWTPGAVTVLGVTYEPVGVRIKGGSSFRGIDEKPSFKVKLDAYVDGMELAGLDMLVLNNGVNDPSMVHQRLANELYEAAGVPAARTGYAWVTVNGDPYGLYVHVEEVDRRMVRRTLGDDEGSLFEMFRTDFLPGSAEAFELDFGPDDRTAIQGVIDASTLPHDEAIEAVEAWADFDQFLDYWAVSAVVGQFDGYPFSWPGDDMFVYADPRDGRLRFLPHGTDETFVHADESLAYPYGVLADHCMRSAPCEADFAERLWSVWATAEAIDMPTRLEVLDDAARVWRTADPRREADLDGVEESLETARHFLFSRPERLAEVAEDGGL